MTNFFLASSLILAISLIIIIYYWTKQNLKSRNDKILRHRIRKKNYTDEKEYLRNFIAHHIPLLIENKVQWILVWSKLNPRYKTELTYNSLFSMIQVGVANISSLQNYKYDLSNLGVNNFVTKHDNTVFNTLPNAKIITDVLYYIFENIYNLKEFTNHKIVTS